MRPSFGCDKPHVPPWDDRDPWCEDDDTLLPEAEDLDSLSDDLGELSEPDEDLED